MSLTVYLIAPEVDVPQTHECSGCDHTCTRVVKVREEHFDANITHNLSEMADAAGIYEAVWRPEEIGITTAAQLAPLLRAGLAKMKADPAAFERHNASNGWGLYKNFVPWLERYLAACETYPEATVRASR